MKPVARCTPEKANDYIGVKVPESLKHELVAEALQRGITLSNHVVTVLERRDFTQVKPGSNRLNLRLNLRLTKVERIVRSCRRLLASKELVA